MIQIKRKRAISFLVVCTAFLLMVSCQKRDAGDASGKITLNVLNYIDLTSPNSAGEIEFIWDGFTSRNSDITINREDLYNEPYHNKIEAYVTAGKLPDVMYVWPSGRSTSLHQNKLLKDLGPLVQKDGLAGSYLAAALDPANQGGGYVAMIPIALTSTHAFYINLEVLNACGLSPAKTYAELKAQVPILKAKGYETVIMPNKDTWVMQSCLFSLVAGRFGGLGWEQKILSGGEQFTGADFVKALAFIKQMYTDGVLSGASLGTAYGDSPGMFATNKGAYMIDGDWRVGAFLTDQTTGQALLSPEKQRNILISVFPDIEGAKLNKSTSGVLGTGWAMSAAIPSGSPREDAAWRLIKWLTGPETEGRRVETGGVATPVWADLDYSAMQLEPLQVSIGNLGNEYTATTCVIDGVFHSDVFNPLNDGLAEIGMGTKTPEQVAAEIQKVFDAWKKSQ
ncbi:MAG: extracellular solute-binding protein [Treponema sp.]|jgi:raffinose/stachyose/melibiose transport system substrate-binding protein|nr:extracellular solute-binding protein [Treponema sp.]